MTKDWGSGPQFCFDGVPNMEINHVQWSAKYILFLNVFLHFLIGVQASPNITMTWDKVIFK